MSRFNNNWDNLLKPVFSLPSTKDLSNFIQQERNNTVVYPSPENVFRAFTLCNLSDLKVVIIGQDPYHTPGMATGLAFGVPDALDEKYLPPSLKVIKKEVIESTGSFNGGNSLENWAIQGVLLLNTALTVRESEAGSHSKEWKLFTNEVVKAISEETEDIIFLLWGRHAQSFSKIISPVKHHLLFAGHPSPLNTKDKFEGCNHFNQANEILIENGKQPIIW